MSRNATENEFSSDIFLKGFESVDSLNLYDS